MAGQHGWRIGLGLGLVSAMLGCGPALSVSDDEDSSSSSNETEPGAPGSATTPSPGTTSGLPPEPTTTPPNPSTSTGPSGDGTDDDGSTFSFNPDWGLQTSDCSVWDLECAPGEKCIAWSEDGSDFWNGARCRPIAPDPDSAGDPCLVEDGPFSGLDSCAADTMCWSVDPTTDAGTCAAQCEGTERNPSCTDPSQTCLLGNDGVINICVANCDPNRAGCPIGEACYGVWSTKETVCLRPQTPVFIDGEAPQPAACAPGSVAIDPQLDPACSLDEVCCAPWCDLSAPGCADGTVCNPWIPEGSTPGLDLRGFCIPQ